MTLEISTDKNRLDVEMIHAFLCIARASEKASSAKLPPSAAASPRS
jgi:hypothetical protein